MNNPSITYFMVSSFWRPNQILAVFYNRAWQATRDNWKYFQFSVGFSTFANFAWKADAPLDKSVLRENGCLDVPR